MRVMLWDKAESLQLAGVTAHINVSVTVAGKAFIDSTGSDSADTKELWEKKITDAVGSIPITCSPVISRVSFHGAPTPFEWVPCGGAPTTLFV